MPSNRKVFHTFKRILPDADPGDAPFVVKAEVKEATAITSVWLTQERLCDAIKRDGFADSQNCAGAVCVMKDKKNFNHAVSPLVDWWRRRVFILEGYKKNGQAICRVYAHYDNIEELFDGNLAALKKLAKRVVKAGPDGLEIKLYPIKKGYNPRTGERIRLSKSAGKSGSERAPRRVGNDLRLYNYLRARGTGAAA